MIADLNEAIRLDPKFALAFQDRGDSWLNKKCYGRTLADYNEAIRLEPEQACEALLKRSEVWKHKKEFDKALSDLEEAGHLVPLDPRPFAERAWFLATCQDTRTAMPKKPSKSLFMVTSSETTRAIRPLRRPGRRARRSGEIRRGCGVSADGHRPRRQGEDCDVDAAQRPETVPERAGVPRGLKPAMRAVTYLIVACARLSRLESPLSPISTDLHHDNPRQNQGRQSCPG